MKKFLVFLLSLTICFTPTILFAGAAEKWELVENVYDKSKNTVNVTAKKIGQQAANSGSYKVQIPVNSATLGSTIKMMLKGGVAVAAITAFVEGVGWVIDEGSKVIKKPIPDDSLSSNSEYYWMNGSTPDHYSSSSDACSAFRDLLAKSYSSGFVSSFRISPTSDLNSVSCYITFGFSPNSWENDYTVSRLKNPNYDPLKPPQFKIISDSELGLELLGQGASPNPNSDLIQQAYNPNNSISNAPAPKQTADALDNANPQPDKEPAGDTAPKPNVDTDGDGIPDTYDPNAPPLGDKFQLPNFCEWAPSVCDFFTVQKQDNKEIKENQKLDTEQNKTFFDSVKDFFNWTKETDDSKPDNTVNPQIPTPFDNSVFTKDRFSVSRQCPAPEQHNISLSGVSVNFSFDMTPLCTILEMARPALVACSYLYAAYIVIGAARNG